MRDASAHAPPTAPPRRRRARRWIIGALLALLGLLAIFAGVAFFLSRAAPSWWRPLDLADPALSATGQAVENGVTTQLSQVRAPLPPAPAAPPAPGASDAGDAGTWQMRLNTASANAWLNTRLAPWAQSRGLAAWPPEVAEVQANFDAGRIALAVRVLIGGRERVVTAHVTPDVRADGSLWMVADAFAIGQLPLPSSWVLGLLEEDSTIGLPRRVRALPQVQHLARALAGQEPMMARAELKLPDNRRVQIVGIESRDGQLIVTCRTGQAP